MKIIIVLISILLSMLRILGLPLRIKAEERKINSILPPVPIIISATQAIIMQTNIIQKIEDKREPKSNSQRHQEQQLKVQRKILHSSTIFEMTMALHKDHSSRVARRDKKYVDHGSE